MPRQTRSIGPSLRTWVYRSISSWAVPPVRMRSRPFWASSGNRSASHWPNAAWWCGSIPRYSSRCREVTLVQSMPSALANVRIIASCEGALAKTTRASPRSRNASRSTCAATSPARWPASASPGAMVTVPAAGTTSLADMFLRLLVSSLQAVASTVSNDHRKMQPWPSAITAARRRALMVSEAARTHLESVVLPFWFTHGIDEEVGGFFTCFDNRGRQMVSTDKFTWSQGRFVWLLSRAADLANRGLLDVDAQTCLRWAERGAQFLLEHAVQPDDTTRFVVGRHGGDPESQGQPDRSVYADWFVVMGLAELARVSGEHRWLDAAMPVLHRARGEHLAGTAPTPPHAVPRGHSASGPTVLLANTLLVAAQAATRPDRHHRTPAPPAPPAAAAPRGGHAGAPPGTRAPPGPPRPPPALRRPPGPQCFPPQDAPGPHIAGGRPAPHCPGSPSPHPRSARAGRRRGPLASRARWHVHRDARIGHHQPGPPAPGARACDRRALGGFGVLGPAAGRSRSHSPAGISARVVRTGLGRRARRAAALHRFQRSHPTHRGHPGHRVRGIGALYLVEQTVVGALRGGSHYGDHRLPVRPRRGAAVVRAHLGLHHDHLPRR